MSGTVVEKSGSAINALATCKSGIDLNNQLRRLDGLTSDTQTLRRTSMLLKIEEETEEDILSLSLGALKCSEPTIPMAAHPASFSTPFRASHSQGSRRQRVSSLSQVATASEVGPTCA